MYRNIVSTLPAILCINVTVYVDIGHLLRNFFLCLQVFFTHFEVDWLFIFGEAFCEALPIAENTIVGPKFPYTCPLHAAVKFSMYM